MISSDIDALAEILLLFMAEPRRGGINVAPGVSPGLGGNERLPLCRRQARSDSGAHKKTVLKNFYYLPISNTTNVPGSTLGLPFGCGGPKSAVTV